MSVFLLQAVELDTEPAWESVDDDYSTGGVLADIDSDGDLDLVTGNGNDMARNPNRVYYNKGGELEEIASWSSSDLGYNGHISLGDVDADGDLDLAVAGFAWKTGPVWSPDTSRIYLNEEGTFTSLPVWLGGDTLHSFSCDWGDADADGDLDLAIASGNEYDNRKQKVVIFGNTGGVLSAEPMWESADSDFNLDVCWVDVDGDGDLDLAVGGYETNRIYFMEEGTLNPQAGWVSADSHHTVQIAFGDFDSDGDMDMATGDNNQIGDDASRVRIYLNQDGTLDTLPFWESKLWTYQSCVAWGDVDADGDLDLAAGGWWEPVCVYENKDNTFDTLPDWSWQPSDPYDLVCEQVIWGEVDNDNWKETTENFGTISAGHAIYPSLFPALDVVEVKIDESPASPGEFLWNPADGWIQINREGSVEVIYRYSKYPDLLVTNWAESPGNFLFLNLAQDDTNAVAELPPPELPVQLEKTVLIRGEPIRLISSTPQRIEKISLYDVTGRRLASFAPGDCRELIAIPLETSRLPRGVYFLHVLIRQKPITLRFQII
ncbi:MAG: T9SS type A sorting domain-containing protein [candidate division WOR-3 bacterium]|nr:T9SS type A sorting domain-containing protein [candidate division WOR-3 bacterium]